MVSVTFLFGRKGSEMRSDLQLDDGGRVVGEIVGSEGGVHGVPWEWSNRYLLGELR